MGKKGPTHPETTGVWKPSPKAPPNCVCIYGSPDRANGGVRAVAPESAGFPRCAGRFQEVDGMFWKSTPLGSSVARYDGVATGRPCQNGGICNDPSHTPVSSANTGA